MKSILIIVDYFGKWPKWFDMYLKSCELNPTIHFRVHTDCRVPADPPGNITFVPMSQAQYMQRISDALGVRFRPESAYRICDLRPMFGVLYEEEIQGYDYFGWADIDIVYGNMRKFYTDEVLTRNVICSNARTCTGHLTLLRNEAWLRQAFRRIPCWREQLEDPAPQPWSKSLDEAQLSGIFSPVREVRQEFWPSDSSDADYSRFWTNNYFHEQWTTPFTPFPWHDGSMRHPEVWYWQNGRLTNEQDGEREFMYLHLMNFKAPKYINEELYQAAPTWEHLDAVLHFDCAEVSDQLIRIDRRGMHVVSKTPALPGSSVL